MIVQLLNEMHKIDIPTDEFLKAKEVMFFETLANVKEIPTVVEIIKFYHGKVPMAVVTGSRRKPVTKILEHLGLEKYFDLLVCAEDYVHGKPAPDCFLKAAQDLGVAPADCLAFEDAALGIESARNAGMACLRIADDHQIHIADK
ncbi:Fructose-1-phosphate phosphatase YqaB [compost metagenome]